MSEPVFDPTPRPALDRASDASLHPALPREGSSAGATTRGGGLGSGATSDALLGPKDDKLVTLRVEIPRSVRKALRAEADRLGLSVDLLVARLAREHLDR